MITVLTSALTVALLQLPAFRGSSTGIGDLQSCQLGLQGSSVLLIVPAAEVHQCCLYASDHQCCIW